MATRTRTLVGILAVIAVVAVAALVGTGLMRADALVGLLGVMLGALISELSRQRSAQLDRTQQLRLAALDRRLQAHQEAYALWRQLIMDMHDPTKAGSTAVQCQGWWEKNCLYLEPDARRAFMLAYLTANTYHVTKESRDMELIKREFATIHNAGDTIVRGVELPLIAKGEDASLSKSAAPGDA